MTVGNSFRAPQEALEEEAASDKEEIGARTLRPKIHRAWNEYLKPLPVRTVKRSSLSLGLISDLDPGDPEATLRYLRVDRSVKPVRRFHGGHSEARLRLDTFVEQKLRGYASGRNEPADWHSSLLSPYLHFGQISPVEIALAASSSRRSGADDRAAFLEERKSTRIRHDIARQEDGYASGRSIGGRFGLQPCDD